DRLRIPLHRRCAPMSTSAGAIYTSAYAHSRHMNEADRTTAIHSAAAHDFSRGAQTYARGSPDHPPQTRAWLRDDLRLRAGKVALDLGALERLGERARLLSPGEAAIGPQHQQL